LIAFWKEIQFQEEVTVQHSEGGVQKQLVSAAASASGQAPPITATASAVAAASEREAEQCVTCGALREADNGSPTRLFWVYALGHIEPRFPSVAIEREFVQATGREATSGLTDRQTLHAVLSKPENRYLVRQLCWVMTIKGLETYVLRPRDPTDFALLVEAVRPNPSPMDLDIVIGTKGPITTPDICNGLMVPIVTIDQIYSFERQSLIQFDPEAKKYLDERLCAGSRRTFGPYNANGRQCRVH
jgi:PatG Domain